jgi:hypothetical protein
MVWLFGDIARGPVVSRPTSYASLVPADFLTLTYRIWMGPRSVGELGYTVIPEGSGRRVTWRLRLLLQPGAPEGKVTGDGASVLDSTGTLSSFTAAFAVGPQSVEVTGTRKEDVLTIHSTAFGVSSARVMQVDSTLAIGDGFFPGLVGGCPGRNERLTWQVFDPFTASSTEVALERERGDVTPPPPEDGCVLAVTYKGLKTLMWVDAQGIVQRQRTAVGWELVLESSQPTVRP